MSKYWKWNDSEGQEICRLAGNDVREIPQALSNSPQNMDTNIPYFHVKYQIYKYEQARKARRCDSYLQI